MLETLYIPKPGNPTDRIFAISHSTLVNTFSPPTSPSLFRKTPTSIFFSPFSSQFKVLICQA